MCQLAQRLIMDQLELWRSLAVKHSGSRNTLGRLKRNIKYCARQLAANRLGMSI